MQPQNVERDDFDFSKKVTQKIDKQLNRIDYSSYKKLAFLAVAIGVFVSAGVYFGNNIAPSLLSNTNINKIIPSPVVINNLNAQVAQLNSQDFEETIQYYKNVMNMYDNKFDFVNKSLIQYNLQTKFSDVTFPQSNFKDLSTAINNHKENITETINKFNTLKNKFLAKDNLNYNEAQFILTSVEKAKQHVFYQDSDVEKEFNKDTISFHKDITKYFMSQNIYDQIKVLDNEIKASFQPVVTVTNSKPKM